MGRALALIGCTGIGKTLGTVEVCKAKFHIGGILLVRNINDLSEYDSLKHKVIIFDDFSFEWRTPEELLHLTDPYYHATVRILRQAVRIENTTLLIFTHNSGRSLEPCLATREQEAAIRRRIQVHQVADRLQVHQIVSEFITTQEPHSLRKSL